MVAGQFTNPTHIRLTISCILLVSHRDTHYLAPAVETEAKVIGLEEHEVTHAIVVLSA